MDLDDRFAQISFWLPGEQKPETLSAEAGEEEYMIPAVLCRRTDRDVWTYGREALETAGRGEGVLVDRLLSRALSREQVEAAGEIFEAASLLALFIKRSLSLLGGSVSSSGRGSGRGLTRGPIGLEKADFFMFTFEKVDRQALEMVERIAMLLSLPPEKVSCQSRAESFFYYNVNQPEELWRHQCLICDFGGRTLRTRMFEANRHTRPVTVVVSEEEHPELEREIAAGTEYGPRGTARENAAQENAAQGNVIQEDAAQGNTARGPAGSGLAEDMDDTFLALFGELSEGRIIDTVYLIGDGFEGDWYPKTLSAMCVNRRVFRGNNLYSKGACYGGGNKAGQKKRQNAGYILPSKAAGRSGGEEYVYLGGDMLKMNLGLEAEKRGEEVYFSLLDAEMNWFDARGECDFMLDQDHAFSLRLSPVSGKKGRQIVVTLSGVPSRPPGATRIHLTVSCPDAETVKLQMEDKGFGDFYPSSGLVWEESFSLTDVLNEKR